MEWFHGISRHGTSSGSVGVMMFMLLYVFVLSHVPCSRMRVLGLLMCLLKPVLSYAAVELVSCV